MASIVLSLGWLLVILKLASNQAVFNPALGEALLFAGSLLLKFIMVIASVATAYDIINHTINMLKKPGGGEFQQADKS